jgi:SAM-dependent methyltransferase
VAASRDIVDRVVRPAYSHSEVVQRYAAADELWQVEDALTARYFPAAGRILDVGCGAGRVSLALARRDYDVLGIDLSARLVDCATRRIQDEPSDRSGSAEFRVMNVMALDLPSDHFDGAIFSFNGIEFVPRYAGKHAAFSEVARVLRPGAHLIFCAHNAWCINGHLRSRIATFARMLLGGLVGAPPLERECGESYSDRPAYEAAYTDVKTPRAYRRLTAEAGLELEEFNSRRGLVSKRSYCWPVDIIEPTNFVFFSCRKPEQ